MVGIFTLEATMAVIIAAIVLTMSIYMMSEPKQRTNEYLYQVSGDLLAVAEHRHTLQRIVAADTSGWDELKSAVPPQMCLQLDIRNASDSLVFTDDTGCAMGGEYVINRRTFVSESKFYTSEMMMWLR